MNIVIETRPVRSPPPNTPLIATDMVDPGRVPAPGGRVSCVDVCLQVLKDLGYLVTGVHIGSSSFRPYLQGGDVVRTYTFCKPIGETHELVNGTLIGRLNLNIIRKEVYVDGSYHYYFHNRRFDQIDQAVNGLV